MHIENMSLSKINNAQTVRIWLILSLNGRRFYFKGKNAGFELPGVVLCFDERETQLVLTRAGYQTSNDQRNLFEQIKASLRKFKEKLAVCSSVECSYQNGVNIHQQRNGNHVVCERLEKAIETWIVISKTGWSIEEVSWKEKSAKKRRKTDLLFLVQMWACICLNVPSCPSFGWSMSV